MEMKRAPLQEHSTNKSVAKTPTKSRLSEHNHHRLEDNDGDQENDYRNVHKRPSIQNSNNAARKQEKRKGEPLKGHQLRVWQENWTEYMRSATVYFDGIDKQTSDKFKPALKRLATKISPFFDATEVTVVITEKNTEATALARYGPQDVVKKAQERGLKVWNLDKLFRFLTSLLEAPPFQQHEQGPRKNLQHILRTEKHAGPSDRDPTAKRRDIIYFKAEYLLVWDYHQKFRPSIVKDFDFKDLGSVRWWPNFDHTRPNCAFNVHTPKAKRALVERLRDDGPIEMKNELDVQEGKAVITAKPAAPPEPPKRKLPPQTTSFVPQKVRAVPSVKESNVAKRKFLEDIRASGVNRSQTTSAVQSNQQREQPNYLSQLKHKTVAPPNKAKTPNNARGSNVTIKVDNVPVNAGGGANDNTNTNTNPKPPQPQPKQAHDKGATCENCCETFHDYHTHINSRKHVEYASNEDNFEDLDVVLEELVRL